MRGVSITKRAFRAGPIQARLFRHGSLFERIARRGSRTIVVNDPIDQLERSHRRLEEACDALSIAASEHDIDTANNVCAFFARQVRRHEEDEEQSLFPRLEPLATPELRAVLERLSSEHREHDALRKKLDDAISGRSEGPDDMWTELSRIADRLGRAYRSHIDEEEKHLFPAARTLLSPAILEEMRAEMDARRGHARGVGIAG